MDADGRPMPVGHEFLQRYDEVVKRLNENKNQGRKKAAPRGAVGVNASMIIVDPEEGDTYVSCSAIQASEDCYAMVALAQMLSLFHCTQPCVVKQSSASA